MGALIVMGSSGALLALTQQSASAAPTWTAQTPPNGQPLSGVDFVNQNDGWAAQGAFGDIDATTNGGQTWVAQHNPLGAVNSVSFADPNDGINVATDGGAAHTSNGGATWTLGPFLTSNALYGVAMSTASDAVAVGAGGTVQYTTDLGVSWTLAGGVIPSTTYFGISFANASDGWAVGAGGVIIATTNGGSTWSPETSGISTNLYAVSFADASHGHAVGSGGVILSTLDGGLTWTPQTSGVTTDLYSTSFSTDVDGFSVGASGVILGTQDNGATWTPQTTPAGSVMLTGVSTTDPFHAWVVGPTPTILAYSNPDTNPVTQLVLSGVPASAMAGTSFPVTVTAEDAQGNTVPGYSGTVHFSSTDSQAVLPANALLSNGTGTFNVTLKTATHPPEVSGPADQTVTVTDDVTSSLTDTSAGIEVDPAAATHLAVTGSPYLTPFPTTVTAGSSFPITFAALDPYGNVDVNFPHTDSLAGFLTPPVGANIPLIPTFATNGLANGSLFFNEAGNWSATFQDLTNSSIASVTNSLVVTPVGATTLSVTAPAAATAGEPFDFTVTALDSVFHNVATGYSGTVHFTSSDGAAVLPANATLTNGVGTFQATLGTAGTQTITATDTVTPSITGTSSGTNVSAGPATHLVFSGFATTETAGNAFTYTVTAKDASGNTATTDNDDISFSSTDSKALLAGPTALVNGVATGVSATLFTATDPPESSGPADQTITATDPSLGGINGSSGAITVDPGSIFAVQWIVPSTAVAGTPITWTLTEVDAFGNVVTSTPLFDVLSGSGSSDAEMPAFTNGVATGTFTFQDDGAQNLQYFSINCIFPCFVDGTSPTIQVSPAAATHLVVSAPATATAGQAISYTVTAEDAFNNVVTNFGDQISFSSTDPIAELPGLSGLGNGVGTFLSTLETAGVQTITATDTSHNAVNGTSGNIVVSAGAATHLVVSAPGTVLAGSSPSVTVTAEDAFGNIATSDNDTVDFTSSDPGATLPSPTALSSGTASVNVTLVTTGSQTVTATDPINTDHGTATINVTPNPAGAVHFVFSAAPSSVAAGSPFTFTVTAEDQFGNVDTAYSGTVDFSSSDPSLMKVLPAPTGLTNGVGTFSATLYTEGAQTIQAKDSVNSLFIGTLGLNVTSAGANHLAVSASSPQNAGVAFNVTVTALDQYGNTVTNFNGQVGITSSDSKAVLPPPSALTHGVGTFALTLDTAGLADTITATELSVPTVTGSTTVAVNAAAPVKVVFSSIPTTVTADQTFNVTITTFDQFGNVANDTNGFTFTTSSAQSVLPGLVHLTNGTGTFPIQLETAGNQTLTVTDPPGPPLTVTAPIVVTPGPASTFSVVAPSTEIAGTPIIFSVTALDDHGNVVTNFTGPVQFSSTTQPTATLPGPSTLLNGVGHFNATFTAVGTQTITARHALVTGVSNGIAVSPGTAVRFTLVAPSSTVAGTPFLFTVKAFDAFGNLATTDTDFVHVLSSDPLATLPNNVNMAGGQTTSTATFDTSGPQTLTVTDDLNELITVSATINVVPSAPTHLVLSAPSQSTVGTAFNVTVTALDNFNNVATGDTDKVGLTSSDPQAQLPAAKSLVNGTATLSVILNTPGPQTLTVADITNPAIRASGSVSVLVYPPPITGYDMAGADGGVFAEGAEPYLGSMGGIHLNKPVVGISLTPNGQGYWLVASDGGIFTFGNAAYYGSTGAIHLNQPIVGMARTPDGHGYWLVAADGGIFTFGDAQFYGSLGSIHLNEPIVAMSSSPDGRGYLMVGRDGGIFAFGDARYFGSMGSQKLNQPIVGMVPSFDGGGYVLVAGDGGVFTFGDVGYYGALPQTSPAVNPTEEASVNDVVAIALTADARGYWIVQRDAIVTAYGDASEFGPPLDLPSPEADIVGIGTGPSTTEAF
jgi:photosystem II stability/assembly factor-like uncharacterized protein